MRRLPRWTLACGVILLLVLILMENSLIYFPARYPDGDWQPAGLRFENAEFQSADGTPLHGWYVPVDRPRAVVLFAHGNAGNLTHRVETLRYFQQRLCATIMIFDYRGYGRSAGHPNEPGLMADARAARAWLANRAGLPESQIVLLGESIGGAVMVDLAAHDGARGLILENTFSSLADVAKFHLPWLPIWLLMRSRFDSLGKIGRYHGPLLMTHGDADTIVPVTLAQRLFEQANPPKRLILVPEGNHNDPPSREYLHALENFLAQLP